MPHGDSHTYTANERWLETTTDWGNQHDSVSEARDESYTKLFWLNMTLT